MATATKTHTLSNGNTADASQVETNFTDILTFLNGSVLHLDGSKVMTGDLDLNGNSILNNPDYLNWAPNVQVARTSTSVALTTGYQTIGSAMTPTIDSEWNSYIAVVSAGLHIVRDSASTSTTDFTFDMRIDMNGTDVDQSFQMYGSVAVGFAHLWMPARLGLSDLTPAFNIECKVSVASLDWEVKARDVTMHFIRAT